MHNIQSAAEKVIAEIPSKPCIVAIDGRCAAGKTTLAEKLRQELLCNVIHADDFFLPPQRRTKKRLEMPGGNIDYERILKDVLLPLKEKKDALYRPYDCKSDSYGEKITVPYGGIIIIEGSYSCHPSLWEYYDFHIFLSVQEAVQEERIRKRNTSSAEMFFNHWIPLEEKYFDAYKTEEQCELNFILS